MAGFNEGRPLTELIGNLAGDITSLFRKEVQLAKAEASEKVSQVAGAGVQIAIGAILALGALGVLLSAAVAALGSFFVSQGMTPPSANALSALIIGIIVAAIAWLFISRGMSALKTDNLALRRTTNSLQRDAAAVKEKF
jgi:hypothetical protein